MFGDNYVSIDVYDIKGEVKGSFIVDYHLAPIIKMLKWKSVTHGYIKNAKVGRLHRFLLGLPPSQYSEDYDDDGYENGDGMHIDHKNGDPSDNRLSNLRIATPVQNMQNREWSNKLGYRGVNTYGKKFIARVQNQISGPYNTLVEAAIAYNHYTLSIYGEECKLNEIKDDIPHVDILPLRTSNQFQPGGLKRNGSAWDVRVTISNKRISIGRFQNKADAIECLEQYRNKLIADKEEKHNNLSIVRNEHGDAIIKVKLKTGTGTVDCIVDDDKWHELMRYSWSLYGNYPISSDNMIMHKYLFGPIKKENVVDHKNLNKLDNRLSNLREASRGKMVKMLI